MSAKKPPPPIEVHELLAAEYEYIAQTAAQATEDRARVSSFYLIAVGSLVAALFSTQLFDVEKFTPSIKLMFSGMFALLTLLGISTIMQLARLRAAWYESMLAMNQIKEYAFEHHPELAAAFRWTNKTLPPKYKKDSVSYYQALETALIGGLMFSAATYFFQQAFFEVTFVTWLVCALMGGLLIYVQIAIYARLIR